MATYTGYQSTIYGPAKVTQTPLGTSYQSTTYQPTFSPYQEPEVLGASTAAKVDTSSQQKRIDESKKAAEDAAAAAKKEYLAKVDSEYNNIMNSLGLQEQSLYNTNNLAVQDINNQSGSLVSDIQNTQGQQIADLTTQESDAKSGTANTVNKARQTYNELLSGSSRFGGSAAQAYGELVGRTTAQTIGEANNNYQNTIAKIAGEKTRINEFYSQKVISVKQNAQLAIQKAQEDLRAEIAKINENRRATQQWKSDQNLAALADYRSRVAQITDAASSAKNALDQWAADRQLTLNQIASNEAKAGTFGLPEAQQYAQTIATSNQGLTPEGYSQLFGFLGKPTNQVNFSSLSPYLTDTGSNDLDSRINSAFGGQ